MTAMVETMAYRAGIKPWHGLGTEGDVSLESAGLNWKVQRRFVRMQIAPDNPATKVIEGYMAITRDKDGRVFQVASDRYRPIQNREVLDFFKEYADAGEMTLETAGALKDGAIVWALAKVNESFSLGSDRTEAYMLLANSHDGSLAFVAKPTGVQVVCWNTLSMALGQKHENTFRMKHTRKFDATVKADAKAKLGIAKAAMAETHEIAQMLSEARVDRNGELVKQYLVQLTTPDLLAEIVEKGERLEAAVRGESGNVLDMIIAEQEAEQRFAKVHRFTDEDLNRVGKGILESIVNSPGSELPARRDTWWGVVNGVTHYADHKADASRDMGKRDVALTSAWFGNRASLKDRAVELAKQYVAATK